jgi:hypothetical protein
VVVCDPVASYSKLAVPWAAPRAMMPQISYPKGLSVDLTTERLERKDAGLASAMPSSWILT